MAKGRVPYWVWVVLVGAHVLALGWALDKGSWNFPDSERYVQAAKNLRFYGELYARPLPEKITEGQAIQEFTIRPIGYPLVVLGSGGVTFGPGLLLLLQNVLGLGNIAVVLKWWSAWARPKAGAWLWATLAVLSFPAQFIYANAVMSEMLLQTAVVGMAVASGLFIKSGAKKYFMGAMGAVVLALLLKPVFYPLAAVVACLGALLAWRRRRGEMLLIGIIPLVVVGLYMGWNWERTGYFHFSSIAEINLLHYNAAGVVRQVEGPAAEEEWVVKVLREANAQPSFATRQHLIQSRAAAVLRAHPVVYARQHVQGMATLFLDPGRFDISQFLRLENATAEGLLAKMRAGGLLQALKRLPLGWMAGLGLVLLANLARVLLAVRGFWQLRCREPMLRYGRWVALGLLLYVAVLTGPLGAARFLVPVWPLLLGLALAGLRPKQVPMPVIAGADDASA